MLAVPVAYDNTPLPTSEPRGDSPWSPVRSKTLAHGPAREPPLLGLEHELAGVDDPEEPAETRAAIEEILKLVHICQSYCTK